MKHKILAYAFLPVFLGLGIAGAGAASANGWFGGFSGVTPDQAAERLQSMFDWEAQILGVSVEDVKNAWAEGKTFRQLADDLGVTREQLQTKMKDYQTRQLKTQLQALVDKGVITQGQMDKRLQFIQSQTGKRNGGDMNRRFFSGLHF